MEIKGFTYYYFIGIGGIGMSALARYFNQLDNVVLGYDKTATTLTHTLESEGIDIHFEDDITIVPKEINKDNTLVIYTPAIPKEHGELNYFIKKGFNVIKRSKALGLLTSQTLCLAVAGTHGKTTTSTLLGHLLKVADLPATSFLGGIAENYNSNVILGGDKITVTEADEFDRSFLQLSPNYAAITSMDADHLDIYGEADALEKSFLEFASITQDIVFAKKGLPVPNALTYGVEEEADYHAENIRIEKDHYWFDLHTPEDIIKNIPMPLPGRHNIENAVAALAMALEVDASPERLKEAMHSFKGIKRRFTRHNTKNGKVIIDDYAHHPTELKAIIKAVQDFYPNKKILGVFQPHLFTRTRDFASDFAQSLDSLEQLILLDIYPAREKPLPGITAEWLGSKMKKKPLLSSLSTAQEMILDQDFDVLLLMGAGDIDTLYQPIKTFLDEA